MAGGIDMQVDTVQQLATTAEFFGTNLDNMISYLSGSQASAEQFGAVQGDDGLHGATACNAVMSTATQLQNALKVAQQFANGAQQAMKSAVQATSETDQEQAWNFNNQGAS